MTMNVELAQIAALIAYGNEFLLSPGKDVELFPSHSTFQNVLVFPYRRIFRQMIYQGKPKM